MKNRSVNMLITPIPLIRILVGLVATAGLVACANPPADQDHGEHHAGQSADTAAQGSSGTSAAQGGMMGGSMTGSHAGCGMMGGSQTAGPGGTQHMDKEAMCSMYRNMQHAPNEQARQAMMDPNMQAMSPEMRRQHMEMMRQQCQ
jgi:hypothetical protein